MDRSAPEQDRPHRLFLGVNASATGHAWVHRLDQRTENLALMIEQDNGLSPVIARILAGRGVSAADAARFLDPTIRDLLPDPTTLTDMETLARRLADAILNRETVAIFGDYDVDGACSSAILKRYLGHFGIEAGIYIPDRIFEGYGPNPDAMRELARRASLIVTVDCGSTSHLAIAAAREAGADVLVIDHHQVGEALPDANALVNPNRPDDLSGQGHLCAAGVVFLVLVQTARVLGDRAGPTPDLLRLLDLVALATVCDVVPLVGVNRAFVVKGLLQARRLENPGLAALARVARIGEPLSPFHFAFVIGPRINAGGRIGDAALGSRLLTLADANEARGIAERLDSLNAERQAMEKAMLAEAMAEADAELAGGDGPAIMVTASDRWHPGIVGLIAARLKEHAHRPAFAIHFQPNGQGTGSGRSISGFDLGALVREALDAGLLVKGGGHAMAAGLTVERARLGALRAFFEERAGETVRRLGDQRRLAIDAMIAADAATPELIAAMERAGPYGQGHPAPVLALPHHRVADVRLIGAGAHLRVELKSQTGARLSAIAFRAGETALGHFLLNARGATLHVAGTLGLNHWNGQSSPQLRIIDAATPA